MALEIFWQLPVNGDGRTADRSQWNRGDYQNAPSRAWRFDRAHGHEEVSYYDYLVQVARAAELGGFDGVIIPQTDEGEEPLIVAGAIARDVRRLKLVPELPAHFLSAVYTAKIATSFQRLTGGRLVLDLVTREAEPGAWHGHDRSVAEQIARADEFLTVFKGFWNEKPYTFEGQYYEVLNGGFNGPLEGQPLPEIVLSGTTDEALVLGAKHADLYLFDSESPEIVSAHIARLKALAGDRSIRFGLRAEITARHTQAEAEAAAHTRDGEGDPRLSGDYDHVAQRLEAYVEVGVSTLILRARPHLEDAYRTAQHVLPRLSGWAGRLQKTA
ncbi:LLM class flavin-dependent oxidoreductase [Asticcacaulis sp. YBE204]|uniref:LLM class flavin-dependent oxidoreductase n=1 Tax=Asticcacaulis sp. YBE204 TaxID=1282363 RepID=UPI0003C41185|nr:LLM class flavin-dependent oxidoreductase [Asticcacaulis sp. YBE204]ESQ80380.1 hypothetical protein AEYBE204_03705 [Asticcacaulis sp. YBE204]